MKRRDYLKYSGATSVGILAGCTQIREDQSSNFENLPNYSRWASSDFGRSGMYVSRVDVDWLNGIETFEPSENNLIPENNSERLGIMYPLSGFYTSTFAIGYRLIDYPFGADISTAVSDPETSSDWLTVDSYTFVNSGFIFSGEFNVGDFEESYRTQFSEVTTDGDYTIFEQNESPENNQEDSLRIGLSNSELLIPIDQTENSIRLTDLIGLSQGEISRFPEVNEKAEWVFEKAGEGPLALATWGSEVSQEDNISEYVDSIEGIVGVADIQSESANSSTAFCFENDLTESIQEMVENEFATGAQSVTSNSTEDLLHIIAEWSPE